MCRISQCLRDGGCLGISIIVVGVHGETSLIIPI
jgi:hypothetical protein